MAKVIGTEVSGNEISSEIDLELEGVSSRLKSRVKREVGEYLVEQTLLSLGEGKSPVSGAKFKRSLSKDYKEEKVKAGRNSYADLEFTGDLKDSFKFKTTESGIKIGHFGKEAGKADGHNNFSGKSELPERRYLPDDNQSYKRDIQKQIDRIVQDAIVAETPISETKLKSVESKSQFWELLRATYEGLTKAEIVGAVQRNESFVNTLTKLGLLQWLK